MAEHDRNCAVVVRGCGATFYRAAYTFEQVDAWKQTEHRGERGGDHE